jgi:beta-phosphoglucomutase-like phosphatase (HAD superfamily)
MRSARPRAVVFDMDGLMLDTELLAIRAYADAAAATGIAFDDAVTLRLVGRTFADCRTLILEHHGAAYPVDTLLDAWRSAYDAIVERDGVAVKAGLFELLDWLEREGIDKAVATSTRRERAHAKLANASLMQRFPVLVGGDEVERGKPEPDIFLLAAERLGHHAHECLVLEDSTAGFRAAMRAGMRAIIVPDLDRPAATIDGVAPMVLGSLHDVRAHLATLL